MKVKLLLLSIMAMFCTFAASAKEDVTNLLNDAAIVNEANWGGGNSQGGNHSRKGEGYWESWHNTFNLTQTVTGLPAGYYQLSIQGRIEGGSTTTAVLKAVSGSETKTACLNSPTSGSFGDMAPVLAAYPNLNRIYCTVKVAEGGSLTASFGQTATNQWIVYGQFKLYRLTDDEGKLAQQLEAALPETGWTTTGSTGVYRTLTERYNEPGVEGDVMTHTFTGLPNGVYRVQITAAASYTSGRGFSGQTGDDLTYAFANDAQESVEVFDRGSIDIDGFGTYTITGAKVTDGTLKLGLKNAVASAGNWFVYGLNSIEMLPPNDLTSVALKNADFEDTYSELANSGVSADRAIYVPKGWIVEYQGDKNDITILNANDKSANTGILSTMASSLANAGNNTYAYRGKWGNNTVINVYQNVVLPAGKYTISCDNWKSGLGGDIALRVGDGGVSLSGNEESWRPLSTTLELTETSEVKIGFKITHNSDGSEKFVGIDNFKITSQNVTADDVLAVQLEAAKTTALAQLPEANASIFTPNETDVDAIKTAINNATTVADVEDAVAEIANLEIPALTGEYQIANKNCGKYLEASSNGVKLADKQIAYTFEKAFDGNKYFYIKNANGEYVYYSGTGDNKWSLSATTDKTKASYFSIEYDLWQALYYDNESYSIHGNNGYLGTDVATTGATVFGNKEKADNGLWFITPYVEPAIECALTNNKCYDYTSQDGPVQWQGRDSEGNYIFVAFNSDGTFDPTDSGWASSDQSGTYDATSGSGSITDEEDGSKTLDATVTFNNGKTYHFTGTIAAPPTWPLAAPTVTITPETTTIVWDMAPIADKENPSIEGGVDLVVGGETYVGGFSETSAQGGKITVVINNTLYYGLELQGGEQVTVNFRELSLYENYAGGGYTTLFEGDAPSVNTTVVAGTAGPAITFDGVEAETPIDVTQTMSIHITIATPEGSDDDDEVYISGTLYGKDGTVLPIGGYTTFGEGLDVSIAQLNPNTGYRIDITTIGYGNETGTHQETGLPIFENQFVAAEGESLASVPFSITRFADETDDVLCYGDKDDVKIIFGQNDDVAPSWNVDILLNDEKVELDFDDDFSVVNVLHLKGQNLADGEYELVFPVGSLVINGNDNTTELVAKFVVADGEVTPVTDPEMEVSTSLALGEEENALNTHMEASIAKADGIVVNVENAPQAISVAYAIYPMTAISDEQGTTWVADEANPVVEGEANLNGKAYAEFGKTVRFAQGTKYKVCVAVIGGNPAEPAEIANETYYVNGAFDGEHYDINVKRQEGMGEIATNATVDLAPIYEELGVSEAYELTWYGVNPDGSVETNFGPEGTDGWRDINEYTCYPNVPTAHYQVAFDTKTGAVVITDAANGSAAGENHTATYKAVTSTGKVAYVTINVNYVEEGEIESAVTPSLLIGEDEIALNTHTSVTVAMAEAIKINFENMPEVATAEYVINKMNLVETEEGSTWVAGDEVIKGEANVNAIAYAEFPETVTFEVGTKFQLTVTARGGNPAAPAVLGTYTFAFDGGYDAFEPAVIPSFICNDEEEEIALNEHSAVSVECAEALKVHFDNMPEVLGVKYVINEMKQVQVEGGTSWAVAREVKKGEATVNSIAYVEFGSSIKFDFGKRYQLVVTTMGGNPAEPTEMVNYTYDFNGSYEGGDDDELPEIASGDYIITNENAVVADAPFMFSGANAWGTQASLTDSPLLWTLTKLENGKYTLDSHTYNNATSHFFNGTYVDGAATEVDIIADGNKGYVMKIGDKYVTADANGIVTADSDEPQYWLFMTLEETVDGAEECTPDDQLMFTQFIKDAALSRNQYNSNFEKVWEGDSFNKGGQNENQNAEKWGGNSQEFDVYQVITGLPNGKYELWCQGFYRYNNTTDNTNDVAAAAHADGTEVICSYLYGNDAEVALQSIANEEDVEEYGKMPFSQTEASEAFNKGCYFNKVVVTVTDGTLRFGIKKTQHLGTDWTVWDNFNLWYMGDGKTAIEGVKVPVDLTGAEGIYSVGGVAVKASQMQKGNVYIINGKKYLVK